MIMYFSGPNVQLKDLPSLFPANPIGNEEIALFINGEFRLDNLRVFIQRVNECAGIILVDGGANIFSNLIDMCQREKVEITSEPLAIIGDLDSAAPENIKKLKSKYKNIQIIKFDSYKDFTDLEAALKLLKLDRIARATLFNALGGRIDQTLGNVLYLLREAHQEKVYISGTDNEMILAVSPGKTKTIENKKGMSLTRIPLYGSSWETETNHLNPMKTFIPITHSIENDSVEIQANQEPVLYLVHPALDHLTIGMQEEFLYEFNKPKKLLHDFQAILHCARNPGNYTIKTEMETIFAIDRFNSKVALSVEKGQTISLIPIGGPTTEINTIGLEWELKNGRLDVDFIGISNVAKSDTVSISVGAGTLLCILNEQKALL